METKNSGESMKQCILATIIGLCFSSVASAQDQAESNQRRSRQSTEPSITWVNEPRENQSPLPPGTQHLTFHSDIVDQEVGYCIYLPPDYESSGGKRYPVIYNLHGNGGNEFTSLDSVQVLHEGIVEGRWPSMIMVLPNGGRSTFYKDSADGRFPIESVFITEFIPYIDANYRTIAERKGRCIEGFSMGGRGSTRLAVKYPEMFCSLFCQAGNVPPLLEIYDDADPDTRGSLLLGADRANWEEDDVYAVTEKNLDRIKGKLRIQIACGTTDTGHIVTIRRFHQHLLDLGIDHTYIELEDLGHQRPKMIALLRPIWFDYHVESLRRAAAE